MRHLVLIKSGVIDLALVKVLRNNFALDNGNEMLDRTPRNEWSYGRVG